MRIFYTERDLFRTKSLQHLSELMLFLNFKVLIYTQSSMGGLNGPFLHVAHEAVARRILGICEERCSILGRNLCLELQEDVALCMKPFSARDPLQCKTYHLQFSFFVSPKA